MKRNLTDKLISKTKPKADGRSTNLSDGGGLFIQIKPTGSYWRYNYRYSNKRKTLTIGSYPEVSIHQAREQHLEARALLARNIDPSEYKQHLKATQSEASQHSFEAIAREWFLRSKEGWSEGHAKRTKRQLEQDIFPWLGKLSFDQITGSEIIKIMQRVEDRDSGDMARRVKTPINQVFKYAKALGLASYNPVADIETKTVLRPRVKRRFAAITDPVKVGQLLRDIEGYQGGLVVRCALQLSALVMLRPGELRGAEWQEIDLDSATWTIPIKRMKAPTHIKQANQSVHIVPLSRQAVAILRELKPLTGRFSFVFPSARGASRCMSENAVRVALRTMGYDNETMTAHGFRGMASTLLNRMRGKDNQRLWDADLIEWQLAHKGSDEIRAAYNRSDSPEAMSQRREMLQAWADYLDELKTNKGKLLTFPTT